MNPKIKRKTKTVIFRLIKYIYNISPIFFISSLMFTILMGITSALSVWALKLLVNFISEASVASNTDFIRVLLIFGAINLLVMAIQSMNSIISSKHNIMIDYKLSMDILNKCEKLNVSDFENSENYNIIARAEEEGQGKVLTTYTNLLEIMKQMSSTLSVSLLIISWDSYVFLLIFIPPILSTIVNIRIGYRNYKMRMERMGNVRKTSYINYLLTNDIACKEVKSYNVGEYLVNMFSRIKLNIQKQDFGIIKLRTIYNTLIGLIDELISVFVIFIIIRKAALGQILIGDTVAYIDSLSTIQSNVGSFLNSMSEIYNDLLYVEEYYKLLDLEIEETKSYIEIDEINEISFEDVSFAYEGNLKNTLSNINVDIEKGEVIAIIGENGSGKTTFIKLLCGFYNNYDGRILINGINLKLICPESLRRQFGVIFQDFNKYELTLRENIGFGDLGSINNDEKIKEVLSWINLEDKVVDYAEGIDTQMGHWFGGEDLSKGQWQRIALGRSLIRDADLYILDEPTASLDPISEREVFKLMLDKSKDRICIFITHRIENIEAINPRVIMFSDGKIVDDNSHYNLMQTNSTYAKLSDTLSI